MPPQTKPTPSEVILSFGVKAFIREEVEQAFITTRDRIMWEYDQRLKRLEPHDHTFKCTSCGVKHD